MSATSWTLTIIGLLAAPASGGASLLLALPLAKEEWDKADNEKKKLDNENKQANSALEANASKEIKEELRRIREDLDNEKKRKKEAKDGIQQYKDVKNDPNSTKEEKEQAEQMIKFFTAQLDDSDQKVKSLERKIEDLLKDLPRGNNSNWTLPELLEIKTSTKIVLAGATVLIFYLMFSKDKKEKIIEKT